MARTRLERFLGGGVGALLGALVSVALVFALSYLGPLLWLPVLLGGLAGYLFGDRAILGITRVLNWF